MNRVHLLDNKLLSIFRAIKYNKIISNTRYLVDLSISKRPILLYVSGAPYGYNLGDRALFAAYKRLFTKNGLVHYPGGRMASWLSQRINFRKNNSVLGGGTLINRWGLKDALEATDLFRCLYVFGTGVGNTTFWSQYEDWHDTLENWKYVLKKCGYIGVRGPLSAELLERKGLTNVEIVGDPVITLGSNKYNRSNCSHKTIGLNIGHSLGKMWGKEDYVLNEYKKLANIAKSNNWTVKWFVVWPQDFSITYKAAKASNTLEYIYPVYANWQRYIELMKNIKIFVGLKLHSVILAHCANVPSIMIEYRPKCMDYMMSINQQSMVIRADQINSEIIWNLINVIENNYQKYSKELFDCILPLRDFQIKMAGELF